MLVDKHARSSEKRAGQKKFQWARLGMAGLADPNNCSIFRGCAVASLEDLCSGHLCRRLNLDLWPAGLDEGIIRDEQ